MVLPSMHVPLQHDVNGFGPAHREQREAEQQVQLLCVFAMMQQDFDAMRITTGGCTVCGLLHIVPCDRK